MFSTSARKLQVHLGIVLMVVLLLSSFARAQSRPAEAVLGYVNTVSPESPADREARRKEVVRRRAGLPILVHRGSWHAAPENTLEAYAAAMDEGADGCEIDIRRSRDGVLYLHHDPDLGRVLKGSGKIRDLTYFEILRTPMKRFGTAGRETRVPTLAAFLLLARQRAMLMHLDVKEPGLEDDIEKLLDAADMWDHIVEVNAGNAERLRASNKVKLLAYKGWWPQGKHENDPAAIKDYLARPGSMIFVEDPRAAVRALKRPVPEKPAPLPGEVRALWSLEGSATPASHPAASSPAAREARQSDKAQDDHNLGADI